MSIREVFVSQEMKVAVVAGVLAFIGAIGGTFLSSQLEEGRARRAFERDLRAQMLQRRLNVLEACGKARFLAPRLATLKGYLEVQYRRNAELDKQKASLDEFAPKVYTVEMQREYAQIESDQMMCRQMSSLYFGPKTREAASPVQVSNWTNVNDPAIERLFDAMTAELTYFKY
jgi:hypothetical protein